MIKYLKFCRTSENSYDGIYYNKKKSRRLLEVKNLPSIQGVYNNDHVFLPFSMLFSNSEIILFHYDTIQRLVLD